jgi:hypothetical protein
MQKMISFPASVSSEILFQLGRRTTDVTWLIQELENLALQQRFNQPTKQKDQHIKNIQQRGFAGRHRPNY